jgi:hypothetical protein
MKLPTTHQEHRPHGMLLLSLSPIRWLSARDTVG